MRDVHLMLHSPQGDTYADLLFTMIERDGQRPPVTYTTFQARDLGASTAEMVIQSLRESAERFKPQVLMVADSCTAELFKINREHWPSVRICLSRLFRWKWLRTHVKKTGARQKRFTSSCADYCLGRHPHPAQSDQNETRLCAQALTCWALLSLALGVVMMWWKLRDCSPQWELT